MNELEETNEHPQHEHRIQIDRQHFEVREANLTGSQLRALPTPPVPDDRDLYEIRPGQDDPLISPNDNVVIRDGLRFFTAPGRINPGAVK